MVGIVVPNSRHSETWMEWILVISVFSFFRAELGISDSRTRGLTEAACLTLAQEVRGPKIVAYCYRDGTPDRGWHRPSKPSPATCDDCRAPKGHRWT